MYKGSINAVFTFQRLRSHETNSSAFLPPNIRSKATMETSLNGTQQVQSKNWQTQTGSLTYSLCRSLDWGTFEMLAIRGRAVGYQAHSQTEGLIRIMDQVSSHTEMFTRNTVAFRLNCFLVAIAYSRLCDCKKVIKFLCFVTKIKKFKLLHHIDQRMKVRRPEIRLGKGNTDLMYP